MWSVTELTMPDNQDPREQPVLTRPECPAPVDLVCMVHARAMAAIQRAVARDAQIGPDLQRREARDVVAQLVAEHGAMAVLDLLREVTTGKQL